MLAQHTAPNSMPRASRPAAAPKTQAASKAGILSFDPDAEIFAQEAPARRLYRVVSGAVRTVRLLSDGRRQIGAFYFPGDWFGIESGAFHAFSAEALSATTVEAHDRSAIMTLGENPDLRADLVGAMMKELSRAHEHFALLGRKTAGEKVATFLLDLAWRGILDLPMRRQDIADYLGLTIETVSRMLTHLQQAGLISICNTRRLTVLDHDALEELAA